MANMTDSMFSWVRQGAFRAITEARDDVVQAIHTNRTASSVPTQSKTRNFRITLPGQTARAFAVVVSLTEIASGSVAGTSVNTTDDVTG